jgi:hypothetical protein
MTRTSSIAAALVLAPVLGLADEIHLRGGGRISGEIVAERPDAVVIEVAAGRVTLPRQRVERIVRGSSALAEYRARAARLAAGDVEGWLALARWARGNDLLTQERAALEHVLRADPGNAEAHAALGHVALNGRWMTADDAHRARGYVQFEGTWVRPEERQAVLEERAARAAERREQVESDARVREAEARARAAEADARRAEMDAERAAGDDGIPYPFVFGGGGPVIVDEGIPPDAAPPPPPAPEAHWGRRGRHRGHDGQDRSTGSRVRSGRAAVGGRSGSGSNDPGHDR